MVSVYPAGVSASLESGLYLPNIAILIKRWLLWNYHVNHSNKVTHSPLVASSLMSRKYMFRRWNLSISLNKQKSVPDLLGLMINLCKKAAVHWSAVTIRCIPGIPNRSHLLIAIWTRWQLASIAPWSFLCHDFLDYSSPIYGFLIAFYIHTITFHTSIHLLTFIAPIII